MNSRIGFRAILCAAAGLVLFSTAALAQQTGTVQGLVMDEATARPLAGAEIFIQGVATTRTNEQGRYLLLNVPAGTHTLRVTLLGYGQTTRQVTVVADQATTANISLTPTAIGLGEIVVTGVSGGGVERGKVPFTVARVDLEQMPVQAVNPLSQIQGRVPGANIAGISGRPGQVPDIILRGPTSINASGRGQGPLIIVDGIALTATIGDINPADIESVEIVKGAAASTLYGSRAAAGVISITTKRGTTDGVRFTARSEIGFNDIEGDFGSAQNHALLMDETGTRFCVIDGFGSSNVCARTIDYHAEQMRINNTPGDFALGTAGFPIDPGAVIAGPALTRAFVANQWGGRAFNPVDQLVKPKPLTLNDFSMSGRAGSTSFYASVGHTRQAGAIQGLEGYERFNARLNLGQRIGDQWSFDVTSYISRARDDGSHEDGGGNAFFRLTRVPAIVDMTQRDDFGRLFIRPNLQSAGVQNQNPLYTFENIEREDLRWRYMIGGTARYTPTTWLESDANFSIDRFSNTFFQFHNKGFRTTNSVPATNNGLLFNGVTNSQSMNSTIGVTLLPALADFVNTRLTLRWLYEEQSGDGRNFQGNFLRVADVTSAANITNMQGMSSSSSVTRQMGVSAGAFLDFLDRYTFDFALRRDGSSRFGADHRWQTYGRASAAWLMAREEWFPTDLFSAFTLRASYGTAGNVPSFAAQYETFSIGSGGTLTATTLGNPQLRPEVVTEVEFGTDIEIMERFGLTVAYANSLARDQIMPVPVSIATGFPQQWQNAGDLRNKTWEAAVTVPVVQGRDFTWTSRANYMSNRPVVESLNRPAFFHGTGLQATGDILRVEEGVRYGTLYGRQFMQSCADLPAGFQPQCGTATSAFQLNDEGWLVWVGEGNNPGMGITHNLWNAVLSGADAPFGAQANWGMPILIRDETGAAIRGPVGHATPDYRLGFANTMQYRRFSLYGLVEGAFGQSTWNQGKHWSLLDFINQDLDQRGKSVETAKPIGYYWRAGPADGFAGVGGFYDILSPSNFTVEDASFVKIREVSASYNLGQIRNFGDWTVSVIGRNLLTFTDYSGFDPETGISGGTASSGMINALDAFSFPQLRTISLVFQTSF